MVLTRAGASRINPSNGPPASASHGGKPTRQAAGQRIPKPPRLTQQTPSATQRTPSRQVPLETSPETPTQVTSTSQKRKHAQDNAQGFGLERQCLRSQECQPREDENPVAYWVREQQWPERYFEPDMMQRFLARDRLSPSLKRGSLTPESTGASVLTDQKVDNGAPYHDARYEQNLEEAHSFLKEAENGLTSEAKSLCLNLLDKEQPIPKDSLFNEDIFLAACEGVNNRNEARVVRDITPLIVPSAELLAIYGEKELIDVVEAISEPWRNCIPLTRSVPQSDYSVGFKRCAFTEDQMEKLIPFIGKLSEDKVSFFMATYRMCFPFLTCEVKCGTGALDTADRQNAHSMTLAVRGIVTLFRLVNREHEINGQILAFSISHDHRSARIYGHYPVISSDKPDKYYRHQICEFFFKGSERWTGYRFTKNVYFHWMPGHFRRICSAVDQLTSLDHENSQLTESSLPQNLEPKHPSEPATDSAQELVQPPSLNNKEAASPSPPRGRKRQRRKRG